MTQREKRAPELRQHPAGSGETPGAQVRQHRHRQVSGGGAEADELSGLGL